MDREETLERAKVMMAWAQGKTLETRAIGQGDAWRVTDSPIWSWASDEYRIKPEPRMVYINVYAGNLSNTHHMSESAARLNATSDRAHQVRKFIEVLD